jgi:hypothetical protein
MNWRVATTGNHQGLVVADNGANIAVVYDKANAQLLAAAPALLAALKNVVDQIRETPDDDFSGTFDGFNLQPAYDAIEQAEGE